MKNNNKKGVRAYSLGGLLLIVLIIALFACGALSVSLLKCADSVGGTVSSVRKYNIENDEFNFSVSEDLGYYLTIKAANLVGYRRRHADCVALHKALGGAFWTRKTVDATFVVRFPNIKYDDKDALVFGYAKIEIPSALWAGHEYIFQTDLLIYLNPDYYYWFEDNKSVLSNYALTLYADSFSLRLSSIMVNTDKDIKDFNSNIDLYSAPKDDGEPPVPPNGSDISNPNTPNKSWLEILYNFLKDLFNFNTSYSTFKSWFAGILAVIIIGLALGLLIKFIKWIKG